MPLQLKDLLTALSATRKKRVAQGVALPPARASSQALDEMMEKGSLHVELILCGLTMSELRVVCRHQGISDSGTSRQLRDRLLGRPEAPIAPRKRPSRAGSRLGTQTPTPDGSALPPSTGGSASLRLPPPQELSFAAIDFETANNSRASACAVGIIRVEKGCVVEKWSSLIRPPTQEFLFTDIHGLTWEDCKDAPTFPDILPEFHRLMAGVEFVAAHNAGFDRNVLEGLGEHYQVEIPRHFWQCTVQLARRTFGLPKNRLSDVCAHLGVELNHHDALSDSHGCAQIVLHAARLQHESANLPVEAST